MNSANNEPTNKTMKIQNDHNPRRLRRKLSSRRRLIGPSLSNPRGLGNLEAISKAQTSRVSKSMRGSIQV